MKRLLVTGASGLLGLNLALQARGRYAVLGVLRRERLSSAAGEFFQPVFADLVQPGAVARVIEQAQPDLVIHSAALTNVDYCEFHPVEAEHLNTRVAQEFAQETAQRRIPLLHISTDAVFDGAGGDYTEADTPRPLNVYARTKLDGERRVAESNPDALIARVNFYGWSWQGRRSLAEWFFNNLSLDIPVRGFTDIVFCPLLVNDMVELLLRMMDLGLNGLYHVVSSESMSKFAFGKLLARQFGFDEALISPASFKTGELVAPRSRRLTLRSEKLAQALGEPLPDQASSMRRFYDLYCQGYPQTLRSIFISSDSKSVSMPD